MTKQCQAICDEFEQQIDDRMVEEWRAMKRSWERDLTKPDPYRFTEKRMFCLPYSCWAVPNEVLSFVHSREPRCC